MWKILLFFSLILVVPVSAQPAFRAEISPEGDDLALRVFGAEGELKYQQTIPHAYDEPMPILGMNPVSGAVAYGLPATGEIVFLDDEGQEHHRVSLFKDAPFDLERTMLLAFDGVGEQLAVATLRDAARPDNPHADENAFLFVFDADGVLRWDRALSEQAVQALAVSEDGKYIAVSSYDAYDGLDLLTGTFPQRSHFFSKDGVLVGETEVAFEQVAFSTDEHIAVLMTKRQILALDLQSGGTTTYLVPPDDRQPFDKHVTTQEQYPWPLPPFDQTHRITGVFCEYRDTSASAHFHNGADVPAPDGSPVYPVADGTVTSLDPNGLNAFVRVGNFAYVHILPDPSLSVGDPVVAGETLLGVILPGQGHVHLVDGFVGSERQPLREGGGLTPFEDPWPPKISDVRFFLDATRQQLDPDHLTGAVEITFRVEEQTAPPGTSEAGFNNGAHIIGYKILSRDRQTEVFVPGDDGVKFRFDTKPDNGLVHLVYDPAQASTSSHVYIPTNNLTGFTGSSAWDTEALPEGDYTVLLFAEDTRGNRAEAFVDVTVDQQDITPPPAVTFLRVGLDAGRPTFDWAGGDAPDLDGFRLFTSRDATDWTLRHDEATLPASFLSFTDSAPLTEAAYFYLAAADTVAPPNVGTRSDAYGAAPDPSGRRLLIIDGFDRTQASGSWHEPWHNFAYLHGRALVANGFGFETAANEAVLAGLYDLADYDAVLWLLGDESTSDETFATVEQSFVREYLEGGGRLFVSGSEIAWDLGNRGSAADQAFLHEYLKIEYAGDDANNALVRGADGTVFAGLDFGYGGEPYPEDFPDYFTPAGGSEPVLHYGNDFVAGIAYAGPFGGGTEEGRLVVLGFPFETISSAAQQQEVMERVLEFLFEIPVNTVPPEPTASLRLDPAYPNPFREATTFVFELPRMTQVTLEIYDVLGRRVATVADGPMEAGSHRLAWRPDALPAGAYFARLRTNAGTRTIAITHVR